MSCTKHLPSFRRVPWAATFAASVLQTQMALAQTAPQPPSPGDTAPGIITMPSIVIIGNAVDNDVYNPRTSSSALRTDTPLQQTPQSVQVISNKIIRDRQAANLEEALENAAGVNVRKSMRGNTTFWIRGHDVTDIAVDGVSSAGSTFGARGITPIEGIDSVEVLKGPESILSGSTSPAGLINVVRKGPLRETLRELKTELTDRSEIKTSLDLGGAIDGDRQFAYRLNLSRTHSSSTWQGLDGARNTFIAPVLGWENGDGSTRLKFGAEFVDARTPAPNGTFLEDGRIQRIPRYRLGDPGDNIVNRSKIAYYELSQDLGGPAWTFNSTATYLDSDVKVRLWEPRAFENGFITVNNRVSNTNRIRSWSLQNDVRGTFDTGPVTHHVLVGWDYQHIENQNLDLSVSESGLRFYSDNSRNTWDPSTIRFGSIPSAGEDDLMYTFDGIQQGLLLQDQMTWGPLHVLLGGRRTTWSNTSRTAIGGESSRSDLTKWVPNYGIAYDITPSMTAYANLREGFTANSDNIDGEPIEPTTSTSREIGMKFLFLDDRLTLTTALFDLKQENLVVAGPTGRPVGTQGRRSRGWDADLSGEIMPGWLISASYTFSHFKDPPVSPGSERDRIVGQPKHSGSLWTSYEIQGGPWRGLGFGLGADIVSSSINGYRGNYFSLGGNMVVDAAVFYRQPEWSLTLGVKNVFDRETFYDTTTPDFITAKPPRTVRLTAVLNF